MPFFKSNILDNTNKSKINKQIDENEKQPASNNAICMKTQYDKKCVDRDIKAGDLL